MVFFSLGTLDSTLTLQLGAIFNSQITIKKDKNVKNMALTILWKERLFTPWEFQQEGRVFPCSPSTGEPVHRETKMSPFSIDIHKWLQELCEYWFWGYEKNVNE